MKNILNFVRSICLSLCFLSATSAWAADKSFEDAKCQLGFGLQDGSTQTGHKIELLDLMASAADSLKAVKFEYYLGRRPEKAPGEGHPMYIRKEGDDFHVMTFTGDQTDDIVSIPLQSIQNVTVIDHVQDSLGGGGAYKDIEAYANLDQFVEGLSKIRSQQSKLQRIRLFFGSELPSLDGIVLQISRIVSVSNKVKEPYVVVEIDSISPQDEIVLTLGALRMREHRYQLPLRFLRKMTSTESKRRRR